MVQLPATAAIEYVAACCITRSRTITKTKTKTKTTRGVQKVLQLDYKEAWKCYKLHFILQYNLY